MKGAEGAFAVVRQDPGPGDLTDRITAKEIVWSLDHAEQEIARPNEINADKGCLYFWTPTRVINRNG